MPYEVAVGSAAVVVDVVGEAGSSVGVGSDGVTVV